MEENNNDFIKKPIEQPILAEGTRSRITPAATPGPLGQSFYQTNKIYIWAVVLGLVIIGVLSYFAFRTPKAPVVKEAAVNLSIETPARVPSGSDLVYNIKLLNEDSKKLTKVRLELAYPQGISYLSSVPKASNLSGTVFSIPDMVSGQSIPLIIRTRATGVIGEQKQVIAKLYYSIENFSSEFVKEKAYSVTLAESDIALDISGPSQVSNAQLVLYSLKYKNNSDKDIINARIRLQVPEGFSLAQSDPAATLGTNVWDLSKLAKGEEGEIKIQGSFKALGAGESRQVSAEFLVLGPNGEFFTQGSASITTAISSLPLLAEHEVESLASQDVVKPGDILQYTVRYQNNSSIAASGVNIAVTLNSKALDMATIQAEGGQVNNDTIIWSAAGVPNLEILNPSESGTVRFSVRVKDPVTKDSSKNLSVISNVKIKANEYQTYLPGNEITLKVSSPALISSALTYQSGDLPPKVGRSTTYKLRFSLSNSSNDFSDAVLTAFLPLGLVSFEQGSASDPKLQFDPATGKITWSAGLLPAHAGKFTAAKSVEFSITVRPSASHANQTPTIVKNVSFAAKDSFTSEKIELVGQNITTSDLSGNFGMGQVLE